MAGLGFKPAPSGHVAHNRNLLLFMQLQGLVPVSAFKTGTTTHNKCSQFPKYWPLLSLLPLLYMFMLLLLMSVLVAMTRQILVAVVMVMVMVMVMVPSRF